MSGTSCGSVDALKVRLEREVLDRGSLTYPAETRERLPASLDLDTSDVSTLTQLHAELGERCADLAQTLKRWAAKSSPLLRAGTCWRVCPGTTRSLATLTVLTPETVAWAYRQPPVLDILVTGGGGYNDTLIAQLQARSGVSAAPLEVQGSAAKNRNALCFAVPAYYA